MRQLKQTGALVSNDAKSCYDRIVHAVAILCMRAMGYPAEPLQSQFQTLQNMKHHIRSYHGDSAEYYDGTHRSEPTSTISQGNGDGPQIWAAVSTPFLNMLRDAGHGLVFIAAIDRKTGRLMGFAFVDDADLVTGTPESGETKFA